MTMKSRKAFALRIDPELYAELEGWAQVRPLNELVYTNRWPA